MEGMSSMTGSKDFKMLKPKVIKKILERGMGPGIHNIVYYSPNLTNTIVFSATLKVLSSRKLAKTIKYTHRRQCWPISVTSTSNSGQRHSQTIHLKPCSFKLTTCNTSLSQSAISYCASSAAKTSIWVSLKAR